MRACAETEFRFFPNILSVVYAIVHIFDRFLAKFEEGITICHQIRKSIRHV